MRGQQASGPPYQGMTEQGATAVTFNNPGTLFHRLKSACSKEWDEYCNHSFVKGIADGSLPLECFQHYLVQDYIFLINFSRAYGLALYKTDDIEIMQASAQTAAKILSISVKDYCSEWDIPEFDLNKVQEATPNMAYTRYVLEKGLSGDILDLYTALAPCPIGYVDFGTRLMNDPATKREGNPYYKWIKALTEEEVVKDANRHAELMERLAATHFSENRFDSLCKVFRQVVQLEISFWEMGMKCSF